jgi:lipid II:glycine glycyltransferase (peptidoglycan interpeptide bridge formation enzyme)
MTLLSIKRYQLQAVQAEQQALWDRFVAEHPQGHFLQSWTWGELKASAGWFPLRLALWDVESHEIVAAAQVLRRTAPRVPIELGYLAYIPKGPVLDWSRGDLCRAFFTQLQQILLKQGAVALRMEPGLEMGTMESEAFLQQLAVLRSEAILQAASVPSVQPLRTIMLDLTPDEGTLLAQMKEKWRYNVRLASRRSVTVRVADAPADVQRWYQLLQTTGERDQFGIHTCEYYMRVWELFRPRNEVQLLLAEHDGQLLAGIFACIFGRQALYLYGASSNEQRHLMPNYLLQWEAIRRARQQGALLYDFCGIPETDAETEAMAGVYRFKRGWGGRVVQFPGGYQQVYRPLLMNIAKRFLSV